MKKELKKMEKQERDKKLKELKFELIKSQTNAAKSKSSRIKEIKKAIARILTLNKSEKIKNFSKKS
jgi:ribosomal protein L29